MFLMRISDGSKLQGEDGVAEVIYICWLCGLDLHGLYNCLNVSTEQVLMLVVPVIC